MYKPYFVRADILAPDGSNVEVDRKTVRHTQRGDYWWEFRGVLADLRILTAKMNIHHWYGAHKLNFEVFVQMFGYAMCDVIKQNRRHYQEMARREKRKADVPPDARDEMLISTRGLIIFLVFVQLELAKKKTKMFADCLLRAWLTKLIPGDAGLACFLQCGSF